MSRGAAILLVWIAAACGGSDEDATGIDLTIQFDSEAGLDRLAVSATGSDGPVMERTLLPYPERPLSSDGLETVLILVPDELDGEEIELLIEGLIGDQVVAEGSKNVKLELARLVPVSVTLRETECEGDDEECGVQSCADWAWSPSNFVACGVGAPPTATGPLVLDTSGVYTYDTDSGVLTAPGGATTTPPSDLVAQSGGPMLRRLSVTELGIDADSALEVSGTHALLIAVAGDATVIGTIDASGGASSPGPGASGSLCEAAVGDDGIGATSLDAGGGGGGGGAFQGRGGDGGDGNGDGKGAKGRHGDPVPSTLVPLRGGCSGGGGGDAHTSLGSGGAAGGGGGAIQIAVRDVFELRGMIRAAGGAGGGGAGPDSMLGGAGGGGGGAGGGIFLEAAQLLLLEGARVCANGGSGGEGGQGGADGALGEGGTCTTARAEMSGVVDGGGDGAGGGAGDALDGENAGGGNDGGGGGGGGGGVGRIRLRGVDMLETAGAIVTPEP